MRGKKEFELRVAELGLGDPGRPSTHALPARRSSLLRRSERGTHGRTNALTHILERMLDQLDPLLVAGTVDRVLIDAPCSGLGTLRRHPEQRWRIRREDIAPLARLGSDLLSAGARLCAPGGFVVYSTCTLTDRENERVVASFLGSEEGRGFAVSDIVTEVPSEWRELVGADGFFQSLPASGGPDGHFVARLERLA